MKKKYFIHILIILLISCCDKKNRNIKETVSSSSNTEEIVEKDTVQIALENDISYLESKFYEDLALFSLEGINEINPKNLNYKGEYVEMFYEKATSIPKYCVFHDGIDKSYHRIIILNKFPVIISYGSDELNGHITYLQICLQNKLLRLEYTSNPFTSKEEYKLYKFSYSYKEYDSYKSTTYVIFSQNLTYHPTSIISDFDIIRNNIESASDVKIERKSQFNEDTSKVIYHEIKYQLPSNEILENRKDSFKIDSKHLFWCF
jgi:hypothetical protein